MSSTRRSFLINLGLLGAGLGGAWYLRDRIIMPRPSLDAAGPASSGWMPFAATQPVLTVPVSVGGEMVNALVDSGAQYSVIDRDLAARLRVDGAPVPVVAMGVGGPPQVARGARLDVQIGALTLKGLGAAILDLSHVAALGAGRFSLVLGDNLLSTLVADIDFPRRRLSLQSREGFVLPEGAMPTAARRDDRRILVPVQVEDVAIEAVLDTGASAVLAVADDFAAKAGLLRGRRVAAGRSISLSGVASGRAVAVSRMGFAGETYSDVAVQLYPREGGLVLPDGLLGYGALERFRVVLDQGAGTVHLVSKRR